MIIQPFASQTPAASSSNGDSSSSSPPPRVSEDQFLQLLVAQIRYQDPTSPADSTAFVTQLAQFSSLEQLIAIRGELETQNGAAGAQNTKTTQGEK